MKQKIYIGHCSSKKFPTSKYFTRLCCDTFKMDWLVTGDL